MKAVILAAGQGTRLRPVTYTMPKPIVPVANKPLIEYAIDNAKLAGITEIAIVVGSMDSPIVPLYGDGSRVGVNITYVVQETQDGLAHAVSMARDFVGDDDFAMFLGDNLFQDSMTDKLKNFSGSDADASIVLAPVPDPSRFGIAVVEDGAIKNLVEKPADPPSNLAIVGVYMFRASIFEAIEQIEPSARGELEITDAIQKLVDMGKKVTPAEIDGWFIDAGKPDPIIVANQLVMEKMPFTEAPEGDHIDDKSVVGHRVVLGENVKIVNSVVRGPVVIGDNTTLTNAYVGPYTSIGNDCTLDNCEVEATIVMNEVTIQNIDKRIERSVLSHNATVTGNAVLKSTYRFYVAEKSIIEV